MKNWELILRHLLPTRFCATVAFVAFFRLQLALLASGDAAAAEAAAVVARLRSFLLRWARRLKRRDQRSHALFAYVRIVCAHWFFALFTANGDHRRRRSCVSSSWRCCWSIAAAIAVAVVPTTQLIVAALLLSSAVVLLTITLHLLWFLTAYGVNSHRRCLDSSADCRHGTRDRLGSIACVIMKVI